MNFDDSNLRNDMLDYIGTSGLPELNAMLGSVDGMSREELIDFAENQMGFDMSEYDMDDYFDE